LAGAAHGAGERASEPGGRTLGRRSTRALLASILLLGAGLRLASIDFALELERARPDEEYVSGKALEMVRTGDPNPRFFHYPSLALYANAAVLALAPPLRDGPRARLASRLLSAAAGVGTLWLVFGLGRALFSAPAGLAAALLMAVAYLPVRESHFGTTDALLTFFVCAAVLAALRARGRPAGLRAAAVLAGLAAGTKYPGLLALGPVCWLVATEARGSLRERARELVLAPAIAGAVALCTTPYLVLDPEVARGSLAQLAKEQWTEPAASSAPLHAFTFALRHGLGLPLLSLGLAGVVAAPRRAAALLAVWLLPFYLATAATPIHVARYALPLAPPLCLAAAAFALRLPVPGALRLALILVLALPPLVSSLRFDRLLGREDTRLLASRWIEAELEPGTPLAVVMGYGAPPVPEGHPVGFVKAWGRAVDAAMQQGYRHLVVHEHPALPIYSPILPSLRRRLAGAILIAEFDPFRPGVPPGRYDALDAFYLPYAGFGGVVRPGPRITIWELR
jgi:hypothetical protein